MPGLEQEVTAVGHARAWVQQELVPAQPCVCEATVPTAALCCTRRGREGELYLHGGVASRALLLEHCQVLSEDLLSRHTGQLELFPELPTETG